MGEKTASGFEFIVKVHQSTTHVRQRDESSVQQIRDAVQPLIEAEKFSGFLAQFPYSFKNTSGNRDYLAWIKEKLQE